MLVVFGSFWRFQFVLVVFKVGDFLWDFNVDKWCEWLFFQVYDVLCNEGMECLFISLFNGEKCFGIYYCVGCDVVLFLLEVKFDSGIGWFSFWQFLDGVIVIKVDFKLILLCMEYYCSCCGGYQGYVFNDGL